MNYIILTLLLFANPPEEEIPYRQLQWSDFRAAKPVGKDAVAEICGRLRMETLEIDGHAQYNVYAVFLPEESFTATTREDILRHEQTHLDIYALMAKKCMIAIQRYQGKSMLYESKVNRILDHYSKAIDSLNECFDRDSHNAAYTAVEARWEKNINRDLNKFQLAL